MNKIGNARILVVDDDRDVREALVEVLSEAGYSVSAASDGSEALAVLANTPRPDVILLDLMMPNMNGFEFRERQLHSAHADIPVVILTADARASEKLGLLRPSGLITKPVKVMPLLEVIGQLLHA
jgi:CheY-like chemotaxis protein